MNEVRALPEPGWPENAALSDALARADAQLATAAPVLSHLLSSRDNALFSDSIVARVRGMLIHLAWQILRVEAEATGEKAREEFAARHGEKLAERFYERPALVAHAQALAIEWQLARDLEGRNGVDTVLAPLLQGLIGHESPDVASAAMAVLAAQTRFVQYQRRMELPLGELDGDLLHEAIDTWRELAASGTSDAIVRAENRLRSEFDEGAGRAASLARLVTVLGPQSAEALHILRSGTALFLTAVAARTGQSRSLVTLSTTEGQIARLALCLRAAGLKPSEIDAQILAILPDYRQSAQLDDLGTREAADWLAGSRDFPR